ncbi:MAG: MYG1 family protein [Verrucomicrobiota bacterium]|nr:MYG1 family protein [Verrucomicrobiota bacterium]
MLPRSFGTHDGSFHADEVTACSLLLLFNLIDKDKVVRTRDQKILAGRDFVCDVGGLYDPRQHRFDHHQVEYQGPLSSAGMVLLYLEEHGVIAKELYEHYNQSLVLGIDAHDNGRSSCEEGVTSFSQVISNFLPIEYEVSSQEMDSAFFAAVDFVVRYLDRMQNRFFYTRRCADVVREAMAKAREVLYFESSIPWMDSFFDFGGEVHPAQFVIMPAGEHWKLRAIPPSRGERMKVRRPLPEEWAGLHEEELQEISGIAGAIFCHKGRFISIWKTKEDAIKALHKVMQR